MKIIAYRKNGIGILYMFSLLIGIAFIAYGSSSVNGIVMVAIGLAVCAISLYILIDFFRTPYAVIQMTDEGQLVLPKKTEIQLDEITKISFRRARAKGLRYRWGSVMISTYSETYKVKYVADCEKVAKDLHGLIFNKFIEKR